MQDIKRATRERAYQPWVQSGHQHGNAESHWLAAQREILSASLSELSVVKVDSSSQKQKHLASRAARRSKEDGVLSHPSRTSDHATAQRRELGQVL